MPKSPSSKGGGITSNLPLIKGYLPVRLSIPRNHALDGGVVDHHAENDDEDHDETTTATTTTTYFYVKEHHNNNQGGGNGGCTTLFVANVPVIPGIASDLLLRSIFGRFLSGKSGGSYNIKQVTVIENPRKNANVDDLNSILAKSSTWTTDSDLINDPSYLPTLTNYKQGKFAHVIFNSTKDMKRSLKGLQNIMKSGSDAAVEIESIEIQTFHCLSGHGNGRGRSQQIK